MIGDTRTKKSVYLAVLFAASLVLAACSGSSESTSGVTSPVAVKATPPTVDVGAAVSSTAAATVPTVAETTTTTIETTTTTAAKAAVPAAPDRNAPASGGNAAPATAGGNTPTPAPASPIGDANVKFQRELVDELNVRRARMNLEPVEFDQTIADSAAKCSVQNLRATGLNHCGHEVLFRSSGNIDSIAVENLLEAWWNSPPHKKSLTYPGSTKAGGAVVYFDGQRGVVAAIEINYGQR